MTPVNPLPADSPPAPTFTIWVRLLGQPAGYWLVYGSGFTCEQQARTLLAGVLEMRSGVVRGEVTSGERPE